MQHFGTDLLTGRHLAFAGAVLSAALCGWSYLSRSTRKYRLPPGPRPLPFIGNMLDLPRKYEWRAYSQWANTYGDVIYLQVPGQRLLILNSAQAVEDLFDSRGSIYSDRHQAVMAHSLMGWAWALVFAPYGEEWRRERRLLHDQVHIGMASQYEGIQLRSARKLLRTLLRSSDDLSTKARESFGEMIVDIAYGYEVSAQDGQYFRTAKEALDLLSAAFVPGAYLVDLIPILQYLPRWMPGTGFRKVADRARYLNDELQNGLYSVTKQQMAGGTVQPCMVTSMLDKLSQRSDTRFDLDEAVKRAVGTVYLAGSDTTVSTITYFFLAMARYPEVQKRAQRELDAVVGKDRLPEFYDKPNLPYIHGLLLECLRWQPAGPLGVPHKSTADDEYRGFFIPKGTIVFANTWAILHDPDEYPDPEEFKPERYLKQTSDGCYEIDTSVRDPRTAAFGFGRRMCPGMHVAERSLFATIANVLAAFTISPVKDAAGNLQVPKAEPCLGLISHPLPFQIDIKPRSSLVEELINQPLPDRGL